jgi:hypothetical protein
MLAILLAFAAWALVYFLMRPTGRAKTIHADAWDCGFGPLTARMQYTATAFSMPVQRVFSSVWRIQQDIDRVPRQHLPTEAESIRYQLQVEDIMWRWLYLPVVKLLHVAARRAGRIQSGHLRHYLLYSFVTLILLLWLVT